MFLNQRQIRDIGDEIHRFMKEQGIGINDLGHLLEVPGFVIETILNGEGIPDEVIINDFWEVRDEYRAGQN